MASRRNSFPIVSTLLFALAAALSTTAAVMKPPEGRQMQVSSAAFKNGQPIPADYTCDGKNISPPLSWSSAPAGTESFAVIADDPDAPKGIWTHWVVFNLASDTYELPENASKSPATLGNAKQGANDFKNIGYGGPCPPAGKQHRYFFKVYALNTTLDLKPGATKQEVEAAMAGHILAQGMTMGTYQRK
jgi:Raf kinase inhibitor-like YbhB/YbcL family protein